MDFCLSYNSKAFRSCFTNVLRGLKKTLCALLCVKRYQRKFTSGLKSSSSPQLLPLSTSSRPRRIVGSSLQATVFIAGVLYRYVIADSEVWCRGKLFVMEKVDFLWPVGVECPLQTSKAVRRWNRANNLMLSLRGRADGKPLKPLKPFNVCLCYMKERIGCFLLTKQCFHASSFILGFETGFVLISL